jgi:hypothetical protein
MPELRGIFQHPVKTIALAAAALVAVACSDNSIDTPSQPEATAASTGYTAAQFDATAKPKFISEGGATPFRTSKTVPYWSSSFTDPTNGVTYPYTMVGTTPYGGGDRTTTVPSVIIPFRFVFADGRVMDGAQDTEATIASPIFSEYTYSLSNNDRTQYGDAIQRAEFNKIGTGYHVKLGDPAVLPTQTIDVPAGKGFAFTSSIGNDVGLMDYYWFSSRLRSAINSLQVPPDAVPLVLTHNTYLYIGTTDNCCVLGYHGAGTSVGGNGDQQVQTYMFGAFILPGTFANFDKKGSGLGDIHAISHEVSEWYNDPFVNNLVQPWLTPTAPQYGCTAYLETGDPVVGFWFPLPNNPQQGSNGVWHPEDEVYLSWFARQVPSIAYKGKYTYMGTFRGPAEGC